MHALEVIVARNERAAAREAAHAFNDGDFTLYCAIRDALEQTTSDNYSAAYVRAKEEN